MERLTRLKDNQIFVFGSNLNGNHAGGAAADAVQYFGAINGQAVGLQGQSYAIPTLGKDMEQLSVSDIEKYVKDLVKFAIKNPDKEFIITPIGCGIAGFKPEEIGPLFNNHPDNLIMPVEFEPFRYIEGYKAMDEDVKGKYSCRSFEFEEGKKYHCDGNIVVCGNGFHFCRNGGNVYEYYQRNCPVFLIRAWGKVVTNGDKSAAEHIEIVRRLTKTEKMFNTGYRNTGDSNIGDSNTGSWNTGSWNTGDRNTGDRNTGYRNTGDSNTGSWNTGYRNTGDSNTGYRNTGDSNIGDSNTGSWNTGSWNTGSWNKTNYSSGFLNTEEQKFVIFNKETDVKRESINFPDYFYRVEVNVWIWSSDMTIEEKKTNSNFYTVDGYLKSIKPKKAWQIAWDNATIEDRKLTLQLPNWNNKVFKEISGIDVEKELKIKIKPKKDK